MAKSGEKVFTIRRIPEASSIKLRFFKYKNVHFMKEAYESGTYS